MIKDFVPAKATLDTGIIIKPHLLERNKIKSPSINISTLDHEGSMETAFTTGSHGGAYVNGDTTVYSKEVKTTLGLTQKPIDDESPMFDGELSGSLITVTDGELNNLNVFKKDTPPQLRYKLTVVQQDTDTLTTFYVWPGAATNNGSGAQTACGYDASTFGSTPSTLYHNGEGAFPIDGDFVFSDINAANTFDGQGKWWKLTGYGKTLLISGSGAAQGKVSYVQDCSAYDSTAPSGYTATWGMSPKQINASNYTAVPFEIVNGELGSTYTATAYLQSIPGTTVTSTGTITNASTFIGNIDTTNLADGSNVILEVVLTDTAGNAGSIAPVATTVQNASLIATVKSVNGPSGYSIDFKTDGLYSTSATTSTTGDFYLKITGIPSGQTGTVYYGLVSTGGGTAYSNSQNLSNLQVVNGVLKITIPDFAHSLANGTVTVTFYIVDTANNQGPNATDSITLLKTTGKLMPASTTVGYTGGSQTFTVQVTPSSTSWTVTSPQTWVSISNGSGTGASSNVSVSAGLNGDTNALIATIRLISTSGQILDFSNFNQDANCIDPETDIRIGNGTTIKAKDITIGTEIRTQDETTLEWTLALVNEVKVHKETSKVKIIFEDGYLICSPEHRVYVDNKTEYIAVSKLEVGDILSGKKYISSEKQEPGDVINLSVEKAHTYISNGILSHNNKQFT